MSEDNQGGFKITDRRLFNPDGSLRDDAPVEEPVVEPAPPVTPPAEPAAPSAVQDAPDEEEAGEHTLFTEFLMSIASSAFVYLGMMEHPATGKRHVDLNAARDSIDMLVMLREKTLGNLTPGEDRLFEDLLADLRMQFVALSRK